MERERESKPRETYIVRRWNLEILIICLSVVFFSCAKCQEVFQVLLKLPLLFNNVICTDVLWLMWFSNGSLVSLTCGSGHPGYQELYCPSGSIVHSFSVDLFCPLISILLSIETVHFISVKTRVHG